MSEAYEKKFATFLRLCEATKNKGIEVVLIDHPEVLGDNYSEIVESLNRLAAAGLMLSIIPPQDRASSLRR